MSGGSGVASDRKAERVGLASVATLNRIEFHTAAASATTVSSGKTAENTSAGSDKLALEENANSPKHHKIKLYLRGGGGS